MTRIAILGLATSDTVGAVRRAGGAPIYAGASLAQAGHFVSPVFTIGDDAGGRSILAACAQSGLRRDAIVVQPGRASPTCILRYGEGGEDHCTFAPGTVDDRPFAPLQKQALAQADVIVVSAACAARIEQTLAAIDARQRLAWIFKNDPDCFPDAVCAALVRRADYVFFNRAEAAIVERWASEARVATLFFKTLGRDGVVVRQGIDVGRLAVAPLTVANPTGAGDTFAGHAIAGLIAGLSPHDAARSAIANTARFLSARC